MDKTTGKSGQHTTVGDLFDKTIDKMFQDKNFLAKCGKQETSSSLNNSQGQVSQISSTQHSAIQSPFLRTRGTRVLLRKKKTKDQRKNIFAFNNIFYINILL